jgi:hypothetical protein
MMRHLIQRWSRRLLWKRIFNIPQLVQGSFISTAEGFIEEYRLQKKYFRTKTPSGWSYAKEYYFDGRLVRRDVTQDIDTGLSIHGQTEQGQTTEQE